jgi:hypothetical protein
LITHSLSLFEVVTFLEEEEEKVQTDSKAIMFWNVLKSWSLYAWKLQLLENSMDVEVNFTLKRLKIE